MNYLRHRKDGTPGLNKQCSHNKQLVAIQKNVTCGASCCRLALVDIDLIIAHAFIVGNLESAITRTI